MKIYDFSFVGGFPFDQPVLNDIQRGVIDVLKSMVGFLRIPDTGSHVLFGCTVDGDDITPGMMYIDGDLCYFAGAPGDDTTKIKRLETITNLPFFNGSNPPALRSTTAVVDAAGVALQDFTRFGLQLVYDSNYVHTDVNFTLALWAKLMGIEDLAEVNVQADCNETNPLSDAFIRNFPNIISPLKIGSLLGIADINGNASYVVPFGTPISSDEYFVLGCFYTQLTVSGYSQNNLTWATRNHTDESFELLIHETVGTSQDVEFYYMLIPKS